MFNKLLAFGFATVCALLLVQAAASSQAADPNPGAFGNAPRSEVRAAGSTASGELDFQTAPLTWSSLRGGCNMIYGICLCTAYSGNCYPYCGNGACIFDDGQGGWWDCCTNRPVNPNDPFDQNP